MVRELLDQLETTLGQVAITLADQTTLLVSQRERVTQADLPGLLELTGQQEVLGARLGLLERRRRSLQARLEQELGVRGLAALAQTGYSEPADRERYQRLLDDLRERVRAVQRENARATRTLSIAHEAAGRTHTYLSRLSGAESDYGPTSLQRARQRRAVGSPLGRSDDR